MCIVLYMKLTWSNGFAEISAQLEGGQSAMGICALCYIYETYLVQWFCKDLCSIGRGVHLLWLYVHCAIYETYLV